MEEGCNVGIFPWPIYLMNICKKKNNQLALIKFCQNDVGDKKYLTCMSTYQLYVNLVVVRIVLEI